MSMMEARIATRITNGATLVIPYWYHITNYRQSVSWHYYRGSGPSTWRYFNLKHRRDFPCCHVKTLSYLEVEMCFGCWVSYLIFRNCFPRFFNLFWFFSFSSTNILMSLRTDIFLRNCKLVLKASFTWISKNSRELDKQKYGRQAERWTPSSQFRFTKVVF